MISAISVNKPPDISMLTAVTVGSCEQHTVLFEVHTVTRTTIGTLGTKFRKTSKKMVFCILYFVFCILYFVFWFDGSRLI